MKYIKTIILLIILCVLFTGCEVAGGHKNTTGSTKYKDSEVGLNCTNTTTTEKATIATNMDFLFNSKGGYQMEVYTKIVAKYNSTISDEDYKKVVQNVDASQCIWGNDCLKDHLELGITTMGFDTVIDRNGDTVTITSTQLVGSGYKAEQSDIDLAKSSYEAEGFTCN